MRIVLSISSDIGTALALDWLREGHRVAGTYRTWSSNCESLSERGATLVDCDFSRRDSILAATEKLLVSDWEVMVLAAGSQEPIGLFEDVNFDEWEQSLVPNLTGMLRLLQQALRYPTGGLERTVIFFAGGGTNNATKRYSAYTVAKIASIKICELLDYEIQDTKFAILGPGWVDTKIHNATLRNSIDAGENYLRTRKMLASKDLNPIENVVSCCNWIIQQPKRFVGGRNFSVVHDSWHGTELLELLQSNPNIYKLRRFGNDLTVGKEKTI